MIVYLTFESLLNKNNSFWVHERNIQHLAIAMHESLNRLSLAVLNNVFCINSSNPYALWNHQELCSGNPKTVRYGTETVSYMAPKIWINLRNKKMKTRICICAKYLQHVDFINIY